MKYKIAEYRQEKGMSITELADKVGVSRTYLSLIENGKVDNVSSKVIYAIAETLGVKVDDILFMP